MTNFSFKKIDAPGPAGTYAYISVDGVDAAGETVGNYGNVDGDGDGTFHGLTAQAGGSFTTFDPPGSTNTAASISQSGEIFGHYTYHNKQYGFVDNDGVILTFDGGNGFITIPGGGLAISTNVDGVTDTGVIYGEYADYFLNIQPDWHGFLNNNGVVTLIDFPGAAVTTLSGINAAGTIVGNYQIGGNSNAGQIGHGFVDSNGTFQTIDAPGAYATGVVGISDAGEIVGNYQDFANNTHGFVDNNGVIATINIPGATSTGVSAVNAAGEVVGYYADSSGNIHGFIDNSGIITTVDVPGATETDILGINAGGVISGYYNDSSGQQHGFVGVAAPTVIEAFGSTSLVQVGNNYDLDSISTGTGPELQYLGGPAVAGAYGGWAPIGVEATASGYEVAWKVAGADQYTFWSTDSSGNFIANTIGGIAVSGSSPTVGAYETSFHQDLNGDGVIGLVTSVIESSGSTSLIEAGNEYFFGSAAGPSLKTGGVPIVAGQYGAWAPIGVEATASGYELGWKVAGADQYTFWSTDSSGNFIANTIGGIAVSGSSSIVESLETSFHQDLNGDGVIGLVTSVIESSGSTSLIEAGNAYFFGSATGPELKTGGVPIVAGEYGAWAPIGVEATAGGYELAWKVAGADQSTFWSTDSSGNFIANTIGGIAVSGSSSTVEAYETSFHQDLNGDGVIGVPTTVIESSGSTSLIEAGNAYFFGSASGPELKTGGVPIVANEYGAWAPIGVEATASGYELAWKVAGADQYTFWGTDSSGNFIANTIGGIAVSGSSPTVEASETSFHQDLNGDGVIDLPTTVIEATSDIRLTLSPITQAAAIDTAATLELTGADSGSVTFNGPTGTLILDHSSQFSGQLLDFGGDGSLAGSDQINLRDIGFGSGTTVAYTGTSTGGTLTVSDAQSHTANISLAGDYTGSTFSLSSDGNGGTVAIDPSGKPDIAEGTLSFSDPDTTDTNTVSVAPQNGASGYLGNFTVGAVDTANGQDSVGWHFNFDSARISETVTQSYNVTVADVHANGTSSTATQSVSVTLAGPGNDAFIFHPGIGSDTIMNATSADTIELDGFSSVTNSNQLASLLNEAQTGHPQSLFQSANGGHDTVINLGNHDSITLTDVQIADLHASNFIID